jgi:hypothetical protein
MLGVPTPERPGQLQDLTTLERQLVDAALLGEIPKYSPQSMDSNVVRGQVIRELLLGWHGEVDPRGVKIRNAKITGSLDLRHSKAPVGLGVEHCVCDEPIRLHNTKLPWLAIVDTKVQSLLADGLQMDSDLRLDGLVAESNRDRAPSSWPAAPSAVLCPW